MRYPIHTIAMLVVAAVVQSYVGMNAALAQPQGTFVAGTAVYRDAESGDITKVGGVQLFLAAGAFQGAIPAIPQAILDEDFTSSRYNNYEPKDEGIFQLYSPDPIEVVSIIYRRKSDEEIGPDEPQFFSETLYPRPRAQRDRLVAKTQLELWPSDRRVREARTMQRLILGIIWTEMAFQRQGDEDATEAVLTQLRNLVGLLPDDRLTRLAMIERALTPLPMLLPDEARVALEWIPPLDDEFWEPTGEYLEREQSRWDRVRARIAKDR